MKLHEEKRGYEVKDLIQIKSEIISIQREIIPLEREVEKLEKRINLLVDEALSQAKYKKGDLVCLKRDKRPGFIKDIIATYNPDYFEPDNDSSMIISYLIGAVDKNNKPLGKKMISEAYFPEFIVQALE